MSIYAVPEGGWANVLGAFSRLHRGWFAHIQGVGPDAGLSQPSTWRPLAAVVVTCPPDAAAIRIEFTDGARINVKGPRALRLDARDDGAERALEIDSAAGEHVRLEFRATARPEELDGIAPVEAVDLREVPV